MEFVINQLEQHLNLFKALLKDIDTPMSLWKQTPEKWCLLEIVCHLYDEEREDFRFRTQWVLENPNETPPPFDPLIWVTAHNYIAQDYQQMLIKFIEERQQSIKWLKSLENPKWNNSYYHPTLGHRSAAHFLNNWLAHDYLHIRQIIKLKFDYLKQQSSDHLDYAGQW